MIGVTHFSQGFGEPVDHLGGDHVVDPFGDPARGLLRDMPDDGRLVALERRLDEIEPLIEQRLARSLRPQDRKSARGERRRGDGFDPAPRGKSDPFVDRPLRQEVERVRNGAPRGGRGRPRVAFVLEPSRRETDEVDRRQARDGDARGEKVVGDEAPHRRADAPLVFRHDRGMGDRQPEGTTKKRDDGEPVGARPDHAGFREGAEIGRPGPVRRRAPQGQKDHRHQDEQQRGDRAHPAQLRPALGLSFEDVGRSERRGFAGRGSSKLCHRSRNHRGRLRPGDRTF